jgi:hypothetical protein
MFGVALVAVEREDHAIISSVSQAWEHRFRILFDESYSKYVRIIHGPPTRDRIGGKLPLVAVYLFDIHLIENAPNVSHHRRRAVSGDLRGMRLDFQFTAWTDEALDEQILLDKIRTDVDTNRLLTVIRPNEESLRLGVSPKPSLKFENSISLWSAMGWPPKISLQYSVKAS